MIMVMHEIDDTPNPSATPTPTPTPSPIPTPSRDQLFFRSGDALAGDTKNARYHRTPTDPAYISTYYLHAFIHPVVTETPPQPQR